MASTTIKCPQCGGAVKFTLQDLARERTVRCAGGHDVHLKDDGGGGRKAQKALDDLQKAIRNFGKKR